MPEPTWHALPPPSADDGGPGPFSDPGWYQPEPRRYQPEPGRPESAPRRYQPAPRRPQRRREPVPLRLPSWVGARPGRFGVTLVTGFTGFGALACLFTGSGPGLLLNVCMLAGTVLAVLTVRPRAAYLLIPVPALMYLIAAMAAGFAADHATDTSRTALLVSAAQWVAAGFLPMAAATILVLAVTVGYLLVRWRQSRLSDPRPAGPAARRGHRDPDDDWSGPATSQYREDDGYPADDSWPTWSPPADR